MILLNTLAEPEKIGNIRCVDKVKILGIHFSSLYSAGEIEDNWKGRLEKKLKKKRCVYGQKEIDIQREKLLF